MIGSKIYTGIVLDDDSLKIAKISASGNKITLLNLDQVRLVERIKSESAGGSKSESLDVFGAGEEDTEVFGLDDEGAGLDFIESGGEEEDQDEIDLAGLDDDLSGLDDELGGLDDLDFDNLEEESDELMDSDMVSESETPSSNELLLFNILSGIDPKRVDLGISIPAGKTIYQILRDVDFSNTKTKDLQVIVDDRLEALHGVSKSSDYYSYNVREDGALLLTSIDEEPALLTLINKTLDLYRGKLIINNVMPDELNLLGLIRINYDLDPNSITGVVEFGESTTRVFFLRGKDLWIVSPIITDGTKNPKFLNTIFSKILFQLDTGEVPNLDRLIICNNSLGETAVEFFEERFQDVNVSEFQFSEDYFDAEGIQESSVSAFTSAIGAAWSASGTQKSAFPNISFLPGYVDDRQKIFKLQWHGILLLLFILLTPIVSNHFYTQNAETIDRLESEISTMNSQINALEPTVQRFNEISNELSNIQARLKLLSELNQGTLRWSTNLGIVNRGFQNVNSIWLNSLRQTGNGVEISGVAVYKSRIPRLAGVFENATLKNVTSTEIREQEVFEYNYVISKFVDDEMLYTPSSIQGIQNLIQD